MEKKGLTASALKVIAMICMFIDHAAASVYQGWIVKQNINLYAGLSFMDSFTTRQGGLYVLYLICRAIGRVSFPLYCFFIVEGLKYTRSRLKYLIRLMIFAFVSEVPFDLAIFGKIFYPLYQNVYFTLAIGLGVIWAIDYFTGKDRLPLVIDILFRAGACILTPVAVSAFLFYGVRSFLDGFLGEPNNVNSIALFVGLAGAAFVAVVILLVVFTITKKELARKMSVIMTFGALGCLTASQEFIGGPSTDYGMIGIVTILIMYLLRKKKIASMAGGAGVLALFSYSEIPGLVAIPLAAAYNGKRGNGNKYIFYVFYPAHLLLLGLVCILMGLNPLG